MAGWPCIYRKYTFTSVQLDSRIHSINFITNLQITSTAVTNRLDNSTRSPYNWTMIRRRRGGWWELRIVSRFHNLSNWSPMVGGESWSWSWSYGQNGLISSMEGFPSICRQKNSFVKRLLLLVCDMWFCRSSGELWALIFVILCVRSQLII